LHRRAGIGLQIGKPVLCAQARFVFKPRGLFGGFYARLRILAGRLYGLLGVGLIQKFVRPGDVTGKLCAALLPKTQLEPVNVAGDPDETCKSKNQNLPLPSSKMK
jgi:hypothetical protein